MRSSLITLTTDFGLADSYVSELKGTILSINPNATIVDVTHFVRPQAILQAVFVTRAAWAAFPPDTVHVAVVDPRVGTQRRAIVLQSPRGVHVGPDNGVLSSALPEEARPPPGSEPCAVPVPAGHHAFAITNREFMRHSMSTTFHGRDIFAPAAAHLSLGVPPEKLGEALGQIIALPPLLARVSNGGAIHGAVVHIDRFGNIITDARAELLPAGRLSVELSGHSVMGPVATYASGDGPVALVGSSGYLEVASPGGNAADELGVKIGDSVVIRARA